MLVETMKKTIDIDPKRKYDITIEEVRSCPWFAHFSNEQATQVIRTIKELTKIAYHEYLRDKKIGRTLIVLVISMLCKLFRFG